VSTSRRLPQASAAEEGGREAAARPALDPAWYDAITARRSRRRYSARSIAAADVDQLVAFCERFRLAGDVRVVLAEGAGDVFTGLLDRFGGAYGRVEGAPWTAAFVGPAGSETEAGYVGEAFVLEATRLGLGTCWVAGMFDHATAARLAHPRPGEKVIAVTPLGHPLERKAVVERMMSTAVRSAARRQVEDIAPGLVRGVWQSGGGSAAGSWPAWAVTAVEAARLAPSGANRQPWRFRMDGGALVLASAERAYWTAPIDFGIAMLHAELGALHDGVRGEWRRLMPPDVARFEPDGDENGRPA
jgi:nitroreductase